MPNGRKRCRQNQSNVNLAKVPQILKAFRQSVLAAACSGRLTEDWRKEYSDVELARDLLKRIHTSHTAQGSGHGGKAAVPTEEVHTLTRDDLPSTWELEELKWLCTPRSHTESLILAPTFPMESHISASQTFRITV